MSIAPAVSRLASAVPSMVVVAEGGERRSFGTSDSKWRMVHVPSGRNGVPGELRHEGGVSREFVMRCKASEVVVTY